MFGDGKRIFFLAICSLLMARAVFPQTPEEAERAAFSLETRLDADRILFPGDVVELEVIATSSSYVELSFQAPIHPHARLLEIQPFPVRQNAGGRYERQWVALYQLGRSGSIVLEGGSIGLSSETASKVQKLETIAFDVGSIGKDPAGDAPEVWTEVASPIPFKNLLATAGLLALGALAYLAYRYGIKRSSVEGPALLDHTVQVQANRIFQALERDTFSSQELERFLAEHHQSCSERLVALIEMSLYARKSPIDELIAQFRKEFAE